MPFSFSFILSCFALFLFIIIFLRLSKRVLSALVTHTVLWLHYLRIFTKKSVVYFISNSSVTNKLLFLPDLTNQVVAVILFLNISIIIICTTKLLLLIGNKGLICYWVVLKYAQQTGLLISLYYWIMLIHALFFYVLALVTFMGLLFSTSIWFYFKFTLLLLLRKKTVIFSLFWYGRNK